MDSLFHICNGLTVSLNQDYSGRFQFKLIKMMHMFYPAVNEPWQPEKRQQEIPHLITYTYRELVSCRGLMRCQSTGYTHTTHFIIYCTVSIHIILKMSNTNPVISLVYFILILYCRIYTLFILEG